MKVICALLVLLSIGKSYAQLVSRASCEPYLNIQKTTSILTCNNKDTIFRYINGVNNSETAAADGLDKLIGLSIENLIHSTKDNPTSKLIPDFIYNFSFVTVDGLILGLYKDIVEAMAQKLITDFNVPTNEAWQISFNILVDGPKNLTEQLIARMLPPALPLIGLIEYFYLSDEFEDFKRILIETNTLDTVKIKNVILSTLTNKQKMIVVSHSQGGLFVNQVWKELNQQGTSEFNNGKRWFTNIQIATPTSSNLAAKGGFLNNNDDFAALIANRSNMTGTESIAPGVNPDKIDSYLHHNLDTTYLSSNYPGYRACAANAIIDAAEQLESNCFEECVDEETNTIYPARRHINPNGTPGGIIALQSIVESSVHIDPTSVVCGRSTVRGNVFLWGNSRVINSNIDGSLSGVYVYGGNSPTEDWEILSPDSENFNGWPQSNVIIRNSNVAASALDGIDIVNSSVRDSEVFDASFLLSAIISRAYIEGNSSIEGGSARALAALDPMLPGGDIIISGDSLIKGVLITNTYTLIENSIIEKTGLITGNSHVRDSYVAGQIVGFDDAPATADRPMAELFDANLGEMGVVLNSAKLLSGSFMGHENKPGISVAPSFLADKATLRNGASFTNGTIVSENAYVSGFKVFMTGSYIFGNARVTSEEGGGASPNSAVHESAVFDNGQVLGSPYVYQSLVFESGTVTNDGQVIKSSVKGSTTISETTRYICSRIEDPEDEDMVTVDDCSAPTLPIVSPPMIPGPIIAGAMSRSIASSSELEATADEKVKRKLNLEKQRINRSLARIKSADDKAAYSRVLEKMEKAEEGLTTKMKSKKSRTSKKNFSLVQKEIDSMHLANEKQRKSAKVACAKVRKQSLRPKFKKMKMRLIRQRG